MQEDCFRSQSHTICTTNHPLPTFFSDFCAVSETSHFLCWKNTLPVIVFQAAIKCPPKHMWQSKLKVYKHLTATRIVVHIRSWPIYCMYMCGRKKGIDTSITDQNYENKKQQPTKQPNILFYFIFQVQLACNLETTVSISERQTVNRDKETGSGRIRAQLDLFSQRGDVALLSPDSSSQRWLED